MIYTTTSIQEVLARVVRNTRLQDSSFLVDMNEWVPEAMGYMKTRMALETVYKDICVKYHKGRMPCGIVSLSAVQYGNCRLRYFKGPRSADSQNSYPSGSPSVYPGIPEKGVTAFGTQIVKRPAVDGGEQVVFYETELFKLNELAFHGEHWYYTELDYFNTSFADGWIRAHFKRLPLDEDDMPLIPDDELYKEALYYYVRAKMIGAGYQDKQFNEQILMGRFEDYARRAMSRIRYPSVDEQDAKVERMSRLIMPEDYWSTFFNPENAAV
jgi:hypothetical protein